MFIDDAHILRASSSTVCACTSKRPAIARIACGSVINRVATTLLLSRKELLFHLVPPACGGESENPERSPPPYPTPTRGTTVGRDCTTCGLAPPRPIIPPGIPPP